MVTFQRKGSQSLLTESFKQPGRIFISQRGREIRKEKVWLKLSETKGNIKAILVNAFGETLE